MARYLFIAMLIIYSPAHANNYYGWAGSCEDIIYKFDFANSSYTVYGVYRYIINGTPSNQYFINQGEISQDESGAYRMHTEREGIIPLDISSSAERIWGETDQASMLFEKCDTKEALDQINEVKKNS